MKRFAYFFCLLFVVLLSSCSKEATTEVTRETLQQAYSQLDETTALIKEAMSRDRIVRELPFGASFDMNESEFQSYVRDSIFYHSSFKGDGISSCKVKTDKYGSPGRVQIMRDNIFTETGMQIFTISYNREDLDSMACQQLFSDVINDFGSNFKSAAPFYIRNTVSRMVQYWTKNNLVVCISYSPETKDFTIQMMDASTFTNGDVDNLEATNKQAVRNYYLNNEYYQAAIEEYLEEKGQIPNGFIQVDANYDENDDDELTVRSDVSYKDKHGSTGYIRHVVVFDIDGNLIKEIE